LHSNISSLMEGHVMKRTTSMIVAAVAVLTLSDGAYAQNNTLATPSTTSPVHASSGYGTPAATGSESGTGAGTSNSGSAKNPTNSSTPFTSVPGSHNTLATPSTVSPAAQTQ
jgi:hypothetical protein